MIYSYVSDKNKLLLEVIQFVALTKVSQVRKQDLELQNTLYCPVLAVFLGVFL
jgi:hypothetical protein